jgi:uncharacterized protein (DUF1697 family)
MALVVLLRGVNVGGHRTFRPSVVARELKCDAVNIGAAGTFVVRKRISRTKLRTAMTRRLSFDADVMVCDGSDILRLASTNPFAGQPSGPKFLQFVGLLAKRSQSAPTVPFVMPSADAWGMRIFGVQGRFVLGVCRRDMKAIGYLGHLEKIFGVPVTTRSWNTVRTIARVLEERKTKSSEA